MALLVFSEAVFVSFCALRMASWRWVRSGMPWDFDKSNARGPV